MKQGSLYIPIDHAEHELILIKYKLTWSNCLNSPIRVIFIHLLFAYSAEIELRIEIFMLKLVCVTALNTQGTRYSVLKI